MHVELHSSYKDTPNGQAAREYLSACVHCGFCLSSCPTYIDAQDERDSPRGRIYLIKALLETGTASELTQTHLDRCLTCRACETSCPSGMEYGALLDIGKQLLEIEVKRPPGTRAFRWLLRKTLSKPTLFGTLLRVGQFFRPALPSFLKQHIPQKQKLRPISENSAVSHSRNMLILEGCVQSSATPNTNAAARRVLQKLGISLVSAKKAGCCGAVNYHLAAHADGLDDMRRNIDAWWPYIEPESGSGVEAIVSSASGCGSMLVDYGRLLVHDPDYAIRARKISELCRDISEILLAEDLQTLNPNTKIGKVAVHTPCSLQHALHQPNTIASILSRAGFELAATTEKHLCCGSAGTYSVLEADISQRLLNKKLLALTIDQPALIATANVGCQLHMGSQSPIPVRHWIELLDECTA